MDAVQHRSRGGVLEGSRVQFFCSFRYLTQGYAVPAEQFVWLRYTPGTDSSKITIRGKQTTIASDAQPDERGFFNSTLTFAAVALTETGQRKSVKFTFR